MRICPACARENPDDQDFCVCGEYLNWELTGVHQVAVPEPETAPLPAPAGPRPPAGPPVAAGPLAPAPAAAPGGPPAGSPVPADPRPPAPAGSPVPAGQHLPASAAPRPPAGPPVPAAALPRAPAPPGAHWTGLMPVAAPRQEPAAPPAARIVLRLPDGEPANDELLHQRVEPGQRERVLALVRNQSGIVDNYDLALAGLPADWWSIHPGTLYLTPFGSGGTYEQEVEIHLHPPRSADAEARVWKLDVVAHSRARGTVAASAPLALHVAPYVETATTLRPQRKKGRRRADFDVRVVNRANAPVLVALEGEDADGELRFGFDAPPHEIAPGATVSTRMRVTPPRRIWIGRGIDRRFEARTLTGDEAAVRATAAPANGRARHFLPQVTPPDAQLGPGGLQVRMPHVVAPQVQAPQLGALKLPSRPAAAPAAPLAPTQGVFRQRPLIPWWAPLLLALLLLAALLVFLLAPRHATVPDVTGAKSAFAAEKTLTAAGLKLDPNLKAKQDPHPPGTVIDQTPKPGARVAKGTPVAILVAVGSGKVTVPSVVGLTAADADAALRGKGLTLGQASPQPIDPQGKISSQIPARGARVKAGTPVMIFYAAAPTPTPTATGTGTPAGAGQVPAIKAGTTVADAAHAAAAAGLVPRERRVIDAAPAETVIGTIPAAGTPLGKGETLTLLVSEGFPKIAFSDGENVRLIDGATGKRLDSIAAGPLQEKDPTFASDGHRVAYVADGQVFVKDLDHPDEAASALTAAGESYENLAWSPRGNVLAMDRHEAAGSSLCLMTVGQEPRCKSEPDFDVALAMHWAPDGKSILATAKTLTGDSPGIVRWRSDVPFSDDPTDWSDATFVTDISRPGKGVVDAALSPDGKRLALVTNFQSSGYQLWITKAGDFSLADATPTDLRACKVAWRSDSKEVAITEADETCEEGRGQLTRLDPSDPHHTTPLAAQANDPTYQPLG